MRKHSTTARLLASLVLAAFSVSCSPEGSPGREVSTATASYFVGLSDSVVRLASGDSVELQAIGVAVVSDGPPGLLVTYYPFQPLGDTAALYERAVGLLRELRSRLEEAPPPFVVLKAVDRRAADRAGFYHLKGFGYVFARGEDGRWYSTHDGRLAM